MKKLFFLFSWSFIAFSLGAQTLTQQWASRYNGQGDYTDKFNCTALDNAGNLIAAGYSLRNNTGRDVLVCKFAAATGNLLWAYTYNGTDDGDDEVNALVIDNTNNIYITGYTKGITTEDDMLAAKIDANGTQVWLNAYNFTANQDDEGASIALDNAGNVIVVGKSDNDALSATNDDYVTIKYSAAGVSVWTQRYNGIGDDGDKPVKVLTDTNNDIYVTGTSFNGSDDDYATLKYSGAGAQLWLKIVDRGANDRATGMALDGNANVYVTGRSNTNTYDYYTVKYTSAGTYTWQNIFNNGDDDRAIAIVADASGVCYVTGQVANAVTGFYDFATLKINADGTTGWNNLYANAAGKDDIPVGIALDAAGNVYVSGNADVSGAGATSKLNDIIGIKYDNAGTQQWLYNYNGAANQSDGASAITADNSGNAYIVGYTEDAQTQRNAVALKHNNAGPPSWTMAAYNGQGDNADNVRAMVRDANGNLYLAGYTFRKGQDRDFLTMKLNANGDTIWTRTLNGSSNSTDEALGLGIDPSGNIIVGGFIKNSGLSYDYFIAKYNPNGDTLFTRTYNGTQNKSDKAADFALDAAGNIYLTGRSDVGAGLVTNYDILTLKFTNNGNLAWAKTFNSSGINEDKGEKIRVDAAGNVAIAGRIWNGTDFDIILLQYNSAGTQQWFQLINGISGGADKPNALCIDGNNNLYVTGSTTSATGLDFLTAKYTSTGTQTWQKTFNGASNGDDEADAMVLDNSANVYITGYSTSTTAADVYTLKYDTGGNVVWGVSHNNSGANLNDIGNAIAVDAAGNVFVAAQSENGSLSNSNNDFLTLAYNADGTVGATAYYNGTDDSTDVPTVILISGANVYVGGGSWSNAGQRDLSLLAYTAGGLTAINEDFTQSFSLYPNPAKTEIILESENTAILHFEAINAIGQNIKLQATQTGTKWNISITDLLAGVYALSIQSEEGKTSVFKFVKE